MVSVNFYAQETSILVDEASPEHSRANPCTEPRDDIEREFPPQPLANVSEDACLIVTSARPQVSPLLSPSKFPADMISSQDSEHSQALTSDATVAVSRQPPPEYLISLGIKVRDFAYENTLPAIVPVPRVPRQAQPTPRPLKRLQRDWDDKEGLLNCLSPVRPLQGQTGSKKSRSLERKPTEPLQEVAQHTRTLERIAVKRAHSIHTPSLRCTFPSAPRTQFSASPPTSPLTPLPSHFASQESELVPSSSTVPFVVHVEGSGVVSVSQRDAESRPMSLRPVIYASFKLDPRSPPDCSPAPCSPQNASSTPIISSFLELPSPAKESGADSRVRRRRGRGTPLASNRYQLRQRPIPPSRTSSTSRCSHQAGIASKTLPHRSRRHAR